MENLNSNYHLCDHFQRLSVVRILSKDAVQRKNETLDGTLAFHTLHHGKNDEEG